MSSTDRVRLFAVVLVVRPRVDEVTGVANVVALGGGLRGGPNIVGAPLGERAPQC